MKTHQTLIPIPFHLVTYSSKHQLQNLSDRTFHSLASFYLPDFWLQILDQSHELSTSTLATLSLILHNFLFT